MCDCGHRVVAVTDSEFLGQGTDRRIQTTRSFLSQLARARARGERPLGGEQSKLGACDGERCSPVLQPVRWRRPCWTCCTVTEVMAGVLQRTRWKETTDTQGL